MKILFIHNKYVNPGGEDVVVETESGLLRRAGHEVEIASVSNRAIHNQFRIGTLATAASTLWSLPGYQLAKKAIENFRPDVVHAHNTFPLLSPSIFTAARRMRVPVVQTLHNYRFVCANGLLLRGGRACELCIEGSRWNGVINRCYRNSAIASSLVHSIWPVNQVLGSYKTLRFLALTNFAKEIFVRAGMAESSVTVKPNSVDDLRGAEFPARKRQILFIGRFADEKGVGDLVSAWASANPPSWELLLVGDGPLKSALRAQSASIPSISFTGWLPANEVQSLLLESPIVVIPSRWYEGLPLVMLEALSAGCTLVVPRHGAFLDFLADAPEAIVGFNPESSGDLSRALRIACSRQSVQQLSAMKVAYRLYQEKFSHKTNVAALENIYVNAIGDL